MFQKELLYTGTIPESALSQNSLAVIRPGPESHSQKNEKSGERDRCDG